MTGPMQNSGHFNEAGWAASKGGQCSRLACGCRHNLLMFSDDYTFWQLMLPSASRPGKHAGPRRHSL